ncbi:MAG TPA: agmatinase family protein [Solirubrobacteraceae bacterium]|jgi:agmatinase|nr:agmatinase family protein [Solirubrobacteraceae bacterium]
MNTSPGEGAEPVSGPRKVTRYEWEPSYVGIQTFLKLPLCLSPEDLRAGEIDIAIGGVPWDGTVTSRAGTHLGPQAIRRCDNAWSPPHRRPSQLVRVDPFDHFRMADYGDAEVVPANTELTWVNIRRFVSEMLDAGTIPFLVGGDHGVSGPIIAAVADKYGAGNVSVVQFDAHTDTAPVTEGQIGNHGNQMWELVESGAIRGQDLIQIGIRGGWPAPSVTEWMEDHGIKTHYMAEVLRRGFDAVFEDVLAELEHGPRHVFITLDLDAADPAYAPGTGSPEPGGLTSHQLMTAVRRLGHEVGIVGMDVVELSPPYDVGNNITAILAHRCILETITGLAMQAAGITEPDYLDPRAAGGPGLKARQ